MVGSLRVRRFGLAISIVDPPRRVLGYTPETLHLPESQREPPTANCKPPTANRKLFNLYAREFDAKVRVTRKEVL
jgi:hypothetical protein